MYEKGEYGNGEGEHGERVYDCEWGSWEREHRDENEWGDGKGSVGMGIGSMRMGIGSVGMRVGNMGEHGEGEHGEHDECGKGEHGEG